MDKTAYKVVITEKLTFAVMEESETLVGYDAWIKACIKRDTMWEDFQGDKEQFEIKIREVV